MIFLLFFTVRATLLILVQTTNCVSFLFFFGITFRAIRVRFLRFFLFFTIRVRFLRFFLFFTIRVRILRIFLFFTWRKSISFYFFCLLLQLQLFFLLPQKSIGFLFQYCDNFILSFIGIWIVILQHASEWVHEIVQVLVCNHDDKAVLEDGIILIDVATKSHLTFTILAMLKHVGHFFLSDSPDKFDLFIFNVLLTVVIHNFVNFLLNLFGGHRFVQCPISHEYSSIHYPCRSDFEKVLSDASDTNTHV